MSPAAPPEREQTHGYAREPRKLPLVENGEHPDLGPAQAPWRPSNTTATATIHRRCDCGLRAAQAALWSVKTLSGGSASSGINRGSKRNRVPQ
jgi:hypothetical protein